MHGFRFSLSAGAAFLLAALYFFDDTGVFSAMLPAVLAHELGHALALRACGARIRRLRLGFSGLSMDYAGDMSPAGSSLCALSGPVAGIAYAGAASLLGRRLGSDFLLCSAGVSAALTVFNLLPAPVLDGGRALGCVLPERAAVILGMASGAALSLVGLYCIRAGYGAALLTAGAWVIICTCKWRGDDINCHV